MTVIGSETDSCTCKHDTHSPHFTSGFFDGFVQQLTQIKIIDTWQDMKAAFFCLDRCFQQHGLDLMEFLQLLLQVCAA